MKAASIAERRAYKKNRKASAAYYLREGKRLKRTQDIVGYSFLGAYIKANFDYGVETARLYMNLGDSASKTLSPSHLPNRLEIWA